MFRTLALHCLLFLAGSATALQGPKFKDTPTDLGTIRAGTHFDVDLRTLLSSPGTPPLSWSAANLPRWLKLDSATHRLSGTPAPADAGVANFQLSVSDNSGETGDINHPTRITVLAPPKWNTSNLDLGLQNEDVAWSFNLNSVVDNPAGGALTFTIQNAPAWMSLDGKTGVLSGVPRRPHVGKYSGLRLAATGVGGTSEVTAYGEVLKTVKPPRWTAKDVALSPDPQEDQPYTRSLAEFVVNPEGASLRFEIVSQTPPPWLQIGQTTGTLFGTPNQNHLGAGSVAVLLRATIDGKTYEDTANFKYTVQHVNHAPAWVADPLVFPSAATGVAYRQPLGNSFTDIDKGDTFTFTLTGPAWLTIDATTGEVKGTPGKGDVGVSAWQVKVADQTGASDTTTLQIAVIKSNEPPVWTQKPTLLPMAAEDRNYEVDLNAPKYATDPDGDTLTFTKLSGPAWLTLTPQGKGFGKPGKNDVGLNRFQVRVADNVSGSDIAELQIMVVHTNHAPFWTLSPIRFTVKEDMKLSLDLTPYAGDPDGDKPLTFSAVEGGTWLATSPAGIMTGTPGAAQVGDNRFKVRVMDPDGLSADAEVIVTVLHVNHKPQWTQSPIQLTPNAKEDDAYAASLAGFATDPDPNDVLSFTKLEGPAWATVGPSGVLTGVPTRADVGVNTFRVRVMDPYSEFADVLVQLTVEKVNKPPRWRQNPVLLSQGFNGENYAFNLAPFAADDDSDPLVFKLVSGPAWLKVAANGQLSGIPTKPDTGIFNAVFEVTDNKSAPVPVNATGEILHKNQPPVFAPNVAYQVKERSTLSVSLAPHASDPDGDPLNFVLLAPPPWVQLASNGNLVARPLFAHIGSHELKVKIDDGKVAVHGIVRIEVIRDPRPPVWDPDPVKLTAKTNQAMRESLRPYAKDLDGLPLTFSKKSGKGWLTVAADGTVEGTPRDTDLGSNAFVVFACNDLRCADAGLIVDVKWGTKEDEFRTDDAVAGARADNLWVVDNSQQCDRLVRELKRSAKVYYDALAASDVHHAGILISSDAHRFDGMPIREKDKPRLFKWSDANLVADFLKRVDLAFSPGGCGNCYNSPIWSTQRFQDRAPDLTDIYHNGYLEAGVPMDVLVLTQQLDHYKWYTKYLPAFAKHTAQDFAKGFQAFHRKEGQNLRVSVIAPKCPTLLTQAGEPQSTAPANAYQVLATVTGGTYYTLGCDFDVARFLKDYADKVTRRAWLFGHKAVALTKAPVETQTMKVWLGERSLTGNSGADTDQWRYDASRNEVKIFWHLIDLGGYKPEDRIRVQYRVS